MRLADRHRQNAAEEIEVLAPVEILEAHSLAFIEANGLLVERADAREENLLVLLPELLARPLSIGHSRASPRESRQCLVTCAGVKVRLPAVWRGIVVFLVTYVLVAS